MGLACKITAISQNSCQTQRQQILICITVPSLVSVVPTLKNGTTASSTFLKRVRIKPHVNMHLGEERNCLAGSLFLTCIHVFWPHTWKQWIVLGQQCSQSRQFKATMRNWRQEIFEVACFLVSHKQ